MNVLVMSNSFQPHGLQPIRLLCPQGFSRQEYTEELYKKGLNDPNKHDGVVPPLEPDIRECEAKWALGSITMNKAGESDRIPAKLFQILKDDAVKVLL